MHTTPREQQIIDAIAYGRIRPHTIALHIGATKNTVSVLLNRLMARGRVQRTGRGCYALPQENSAQ